jgi:two-component system response regulator
MSGTILLVEDNPDDAELTRLALERLKKDVRVAHVTDGAQALDYLADDARAAQVRFVILDMKLPKVDGMQVLAKMKADPRTRSIPVVILSSSNRDSEIVGCFALGVNSYVVKPVELEDYLEKVSAVGRYWDEVNQPLPAR